MTIAHRPFTVVDGASGPVHRAPTLGKHADVHRHLVTGSGPSRMITIAPAGTAYRVMAS